MNSQGQLVSGMSTTVFQPLHIDVQMEYEIDETLFPGIEDPLKNPPALIYDLTQDDDVTEDEDIVSLIGMYRI